MLEKKCARPPKTALFVPYTEVAAENFGSKPGHAARLWHNRTLPFEAIREEYESGAWLHGGNTLVLYIYASIVRLQANIFSNFSAHADGEPPRG